VTILSDRWNGLRRVPHVMLADLPTGVEHLAALSKWAGAEIWIKRDDRSAARYGGNKVRKLEYLLGDAFAKEADTLVAVGAAGSHHALASAIFGAQQGFDVHAVLMPQRFSAHVEEQLRAMLAAGAEIHPVRSPALLFPAASALSARLRMRGRKPFAMGPGGSSIAGVIGHVEGGLELARQIEAGVLPEPEAIYVALGSGGTAAGLAIGLAASGVTARIVAVRVVPRPLANRARLRSIIGNTVRHLRELDDRFPDVAETARSLIDVDHGELGEGYGEPTSTGQNASRLARELEHFELDQTYTAKALAAALRDARGSLAGSRILYVHTLSSVDLGPLVRGAPPLPRALEALLRR
jgi:D-cysteine desulfhydrase